MCIRNYTCTHPVRVYRYIYLHFSSKKSSNIELDFDHLGLLNWHLICEASPTPRIHGANDPSVAELPWLAEVTGNPTGVEVAVADLKWLQRKRPVASKLNSNGKI